MFSEEADKIEKYVGGLPDMIYGSSPEYVPESDFEAHPEDDDDEDPEDDPVDYPADGGDDGDDEEESSEYNEDEEDDDEIDVKADEEEEHPSPADSVVVAPTAADQAPSAEETEPFKTDEFVATPPPHPAYRTTARISIPAPVPMPAWTDSEVVRLLAISSPPASPLSLWSLPPPQIPFPPLPPILSPPSPVLSLAPPPSPVHSLGYRAAMIRLRDEATSTSSPPLQLPSVSRREDRPEVTLPPWKMLDIALGPRYEREVGYGITDSRDEIVETLQGAPVSTDTELGGYLLAGRLNMLFRDKRAYAYTRQLMETEARMSREAWVQAKDASDLVHGEVMSLRTTVLGPMSEIRELQAADRRRQTVISELLRIDHRRSTEISEDSRDLLEIIHSRSYQRRLVAVHRLDLLWLVISFCISLLSFTCSIPASKALDYEAMINQGVTVALAARDALRSTNGDDNHNSETGKTLMKMMTEKYCPRNEIRKLKMEIWDLKVKGTDLASYTQRFQELALLCERMFFEEADKIEKYVRGLPDMIHGSVVASKPKTMQEVIEIATELMDKKIRTFAERETVSKRKFKNTSRNTQNQQQHSNKRQNTGRVYTAASGEKKQYVGSRPLCAKCNYHHDGPCAPKCCNYNKIGHSARDCRGAANDEQEYDEEEYDEETMDEESFDPILKTPENSDDKGNGEEDLGLNVGREEGHDEEEEEDELYKDVNINQGRGIQMNQEVKDSHVTLTLINPDGQQQSSSVSSQFVTSMLNPTLDVGMESIFETTSQMGAQTPTSRMNEGVQVAVQLQSDKLREEAQKETDEFLKTIDENMQNIIKEQVKEQVKRRRDDDADKDEEPSAGPDRGSKRRREGKEHESASAPTETATRSANRSTQGTRSRQTSVSESATAEEPMQTIFQMEELAHPEFETAQLQDKGIVISELKKLIEKLKGKSVDTKDGENLNKMKEKGDECIFVGSDPAPTSQTMASVQISFDPAPKCQPMALAHDSVSPGRKCQENVSHGDKIGTTSNELDLMFSLMFDELLNGSSKVVSKSSTVSAADAPNQRQQLITPLNNHTTPAPTYGPTYDLMKGSCKILVELEYHLEEVYKATTDQLDWVNPEGQQYPHNLLKPLPLIPNNRGHRVIPFEHFINNDLEYIRGGASSRKYTTSITKTKAANYGHIKWKEDLVPRTMWIEEPIGYDKHAL
nr:hypothetical protein [Tanacetum cinerariifolium]